MRVEFNPNKLTRDEMLWLKRNIIDYMEDIGLTRIDLAFDFEYDLSDYYTLSDKAVKKTFFMVKMVSRKQNKIGGRESNRFIRIYNKKKERKDNADITINSEHLWRVEIELKRNMVDRWKDCFNDLHILKPNLKSVDNVKERAMIYLLINEEDEWGNLERRTKNKYKELLKNTADIDLTDVLKSTLKNNEKQLQKQVDFWFSDFRF